MKYLAILHRTLPQKRQSDPTSTWNRIIPNKYSPAIPPHHNSHSLSTYDPESTRVNRIIQPPIHPLNSQHQIDIVYAPSQAPVSSSYLGFKHCDPDLIETAVPRVWNT